MPPPPVPKKKHERGVVTVTVVAARNLRDMERFGKMDPYVTVRLDEAARSTAVVKGGGCACEFGDELLYHVEERPTSLCVDVFDKEKVGSDDHVGSGEVTLVGKKIVGGGLSETVVLHENFGEVDLQIRFQHDGTPLTLSGYLEKKSSSWPRWDRRWFELRGTLLVYYHEDASGSKRAAGEVSLLECTDVRSSTVPDARESEWELLHEARTYRLAAGSDEEALAWIEACRAHISGDPPGTDSAEVGSPTRDDAMAVSEGTPRGRSAPREAAVVRKYLSAMTGKPAKGQVRIVGGTANSYQRCCTLTFPLCAPGHVRGAQIGSATLRVSQQVRPWYCV
jgi:hypothetical protein